VNPRGRCTELRRPRRSSAAQAGVTAVGIGCVDRMRSRGSYWALTAAEPFAGRGRVAETTVPFPASRWGGPKSLEGQLIQFAHGVSDTSDPMFWFLLLRLERLLPCEQPVWNDGVSDRSFRVEPPK